MTSEIDRRRAERVLGAARIDALVIAEPEGFWTVTGAPPGVPALFRRAGAALAVLPADPSLPVFAVASDMAASGLVAAGIEHRTHPSWVDVANFPAEPFDKAVARTIGARAADFARPTTFDRMKAFALLGELLDSRGLGRARIGVDLDFWPVSDFRALNNALPGPTFVDGSLAFERLRAVKPAAAVAALTVAAELAQAGVSAALSELREGMTRAEIAAAWSHGVDAEAARRMIQPPPRAEYIAFGANPWAGGDRLARGDVVKFDVGCTIDGHLSDCARTVTLGLARERSGAIHAALYEGFCVGRERLKPGTPMREVHRATTAAVRVAGLHGWSRGHVGHGLGRGVFGEMWPFLSADTEDVLEAGMVVAFETPFYANGEGGFIIEDQFVITQTGAVAAWTLPHALQETG